MVHHPELVSFRRAILTMVTACSTNILSEISRGALPLFLAKASTICCSLLWGNASSVQTYTAPETVKHTASLTPVVLLDNFKVT